MSWLPGAGQARSRSKVVSALAGCAALMAAPLTAAVVSTFVGVAPASATTTSAVTDVNPNQATACGSCSPDLFGGRSGAFAVNPVNPQIVFDATEDGGLWESTNGASTWSHVDAVPLTVMSDVKFASSDANLVIATGAYDGSSDNRGGGIWRSTDGGTTWSQAPGSNVCTSYSGGGSLSQNNAHKIAIAPGTPGSLTVFVATDCGIAKSTDSGSSWALVPGLNPGSQVLDVKVIPVNGQLYVDACGDNNFVRSQDGGQTFPVIDNSIFSTGHISSPNACSIAEAPQDPKTIFFTAYDDTSSVGNSPLWENDNGGTGSWHNLNVSSDGNGRPSWVITAPGFDGVATDFEVFYGTDSVVVHQTCSTLNTPRCGDGTGASTKGGSNSGPWTLYDTSILGVHHATDPATLAFNPFSGCPFLEGGDPGVFATSDGCDTTPTFTPSNSGEHALEIYQLTGTAITSPSVHTDVYYGMQDNGLVWSTNGGNNWMTDGGGGSFAADSFQTSADRTGPPSAVLINSDNSYTLGSSDNPFATTSFTPPPGGSGPLAQFGNQSYAFITSNGKTPPTYNVQVTTDAGSTWTQLGPNLPGAPAGLPAGGQAIVASGTPTSPVFYLELTVSNAATLYRLSGPLNSTATLTQVNSGLTSPSAFNVNPSNPAQLYVVDTGANGGAGAAMFSTNGGASWSTDSTLTNIVTAGGVYPFDNSVGGDISAFGFDPASNTILAGTNFTGIYASVDSGAHWFLVPGSKQISRVTSLFFDNNNPGTSYVGSFGRGAWKLIIPTADLSITKTTSPNPVIAGTQLTDTITVTNSGPDDALGPIVTDQLPAQVTYQTNDLPDPTVCSSDNNPAGPKVTCYLSPIPAGTSVTFHIVTNVLSNAIATTGPTSVADTASVIDTSSIDPTPSDNTATATTLINDSADLSVAKQCKPDSTTIYEGQQINCTVYVTNNGPSYARDVVIDDTTLSDGTFAVSNWSVTGGPTSCTLSPVNGGQDLSCSVGNLANASTSQTGQVSLYYTITPTSKSVNGQSIDNTASVRSDTPDPTSNDNSATVNLAVTATADEALAMTGPASVVAGTPISWTLTATNNGPSDAANTAITDTVPAGVTITSVTMSGATCTTGVAGDPSQPTVCQLGTLAAGATSASMFINATVNPRTTGTLQNNARVSSSTYDTNMANNLATSSTTVNVVSSIAVAITATPNTVIAGTPLSYQLTVSNGGPSAATAVALTDTLPAGVTFMSTGGVGTCGYQTNTNLVACQLPNLDPGQNEVVYIYTGVKSSTLPPSITDSATATATGSPGASANLTTNVQTSADLAITLTSNADTYKPSSTIHYQITVTNNGPSDAQNLVITQYLPTVKQGKYVSNSLGCPPPSGTTLVCSYTTIAVLQTLTSGASITFQVNFYITGNKQTVTSTATVTSATSDPNTANNTSTRYVTVS